MQYEIRVLNFDFFRKYEMLKSNLNAMTAAQLENESVEGPSRK